MTRYFYDCEFIEDGRTIDLLSIGLVADDGREYYAVNGDTKVWRRVRKHPWLMENVVPHLPKAYGDARNHMPAGWLFNYADPAVRPLATIAIEVEAFIRAGGDSRDEHELWAYYGAYDHVALCQLWGRMIDLPGCVPMWTHDLMHFGEWIDLARKRVPQQDEHHALSDARWDRDIYNWIKEHR
jgi:hypothetical protein